VRHDGEELIFLLVFLAQGFLGELSVVDVGADRDPSIHLAARAARRRIDPAQPPLAEPRHARKALVLRPLALEHKID